MIAGVRLAPSPDPPFSNDIISSSAVILLVASQHDQAHDEEA